MEQGKGALEGQLRFEIRRRGMAIRTEATYVSWYRRFIRFHNMRHPREMGVEDVAEGGARVYVEKALDLKYGGKLSRSWEWFWVFPTANRAVDPWDGDLKRHHILEGAVSQWLRGAAVRGQIAKKVTAHTLRHQL